ncbi:hypothetical protein ACFC1B_27190 [Streptomyces xiamenensis]|uniref:hypothetical protein n=1 Tax=Streptomyces xiamenensis TaxID=408015 RepID=UPI0035D8D5D5
MTAPIRPHIEAAAAELRAKPDLVERYHATCEALQEAEESITLLREVKREIALELRAGDGKQRTWVEVGRLLGGLSRQRAEQIARGV